MQLRSLRLVLGAGVLVWPARADAAVTPFVQDFTTSTVGSDISSSGLTESNQTSSGTAATDYTIADYGASERGLVADITGTGSGTAAATASRSAAVQLTDLGASKSSFRYTASIVLNSFAAGGGTINLGLAALGSAGDFSTGTQYRLLYTPSSSKLSIGKISGGSAQATGFTATTGTTSTGTATSTGSLTPTNGLTATLSLDGDFIGNALYLTGKLTSGSAVLNVAATDTSPYTGSYFGFRTALSSGAATTSSESVTYDNISIAVPEPTALGLFGPAMIGLLARRRRMA